MHIQPHTLQLLILTASCILAVMAYSPNSKKNQILAKKNWKLYSYFHGLNCGARGHGLFSVLLLSTLPKLSLYFIRKSQQNIIILTVNTKKLAYFELQFLFTKMQNLFSLELQITPRYYNLGISDSVCFLYLARFDRKDLD